MKYSLILIMSLLLLALKCEEKSNQSSVVKSLNYLTIKQKLYPTPFVKEYLITKDSLKVSLINSKSNKDSLLIFKSIDTVVLNNLIEKFGNLKDSLYTNKCISDGVIFDIEYISNQNKRKIRFSNVYNKNLDSIIFFINANIYLKKDKIYYDKDKLNSLRTDCN